MQNCFNFDNSILFVKWFKKGSAWQINKIGDDRSLLLFPAINSKSNDKFQRFKNHDFQK